MGLFLESSLTKKKKKRKNKTRKICLLLFANIVIPVYKPDLDSRYADLSNRNLSRLVSKKHQLRTVISLLLSRLKRIKKFVLLLLYLCSRSSSSSPLPFSFLTSNFIDSFLSCPFPLSNYFHYSILLLSEGKCRIILKFNNNKKNPRVLFKEDEKSKRK